MKKKINCSEYAREIEAAKSLLDDADYNGLLLDIATQAHKPKKKGAPSILEIDNYRAGFVHTCIRQGMTQREGLKLTHYLLGDCEEDAIKKSCQRVIRLKSYEENEEIFSKSFLAGVYDRMLRLIFNIKDLVRAHRVNYFKNESRKIQSLASSNKTEIKKISETSFTDAFYNLKSSFAWGSISEIQESYNRVSSHPVSYKKIKKICQEIGWLSVKGNI